jgi:ribosomal protein S18 acetylase RimI-like enzyme
MPHRKSFRETVRPDDVDSVERIVCSSGVFNPAEIEIAKELVEEHLRRGAAASGYHFLFADGLDGLDGYVCFGPIPATDARFELYWIAVRPETCRKGLGRALQSAAEEKSRELGAKYLIAETSTTKAYEPARGFYLSAGYAHLGSIPNWYSDSDGRAVFGKRL